MWLMLGMTKIYPYIKGEPHGECINSTVTHLLEGRCFYESVLQSIRKIITVGCRRAAGGDIGEKAQGIGEFDCCL